MDKFIKFNINGKQISFYDCGDKNADIVYVSSYIDSAERLLSECKKLIKKLEAQMAEYADMLLFEEAAVIRDKIEEIKRIGS